MMHRTQSVFARSTIICTLAGASLSLMALSGCGSDNDAQAAVKQAGRSFTSIAVGDPNASPEYSEQSYQATEKALSEFTGKDDGYSQAAALGVAMAKRGQAALASQEASKAEKEAILQARVIRGMINEWLTMDAIAQAAGMFDPSKDISELQDIIKLRQQDIANYKSDMDRINAEISEHEAKIAELRVKAEEQRNQAGAIELQMPRVSAQEAAKLAEQVREFSLRSDQYELEAQRIEGVVGQLRPGAREVSLNVNKASSQVELLNTAIAELRDRAQASQQDAQQARQNARDTLQNINDAVDQYQALRDNEVNTANERAISLVRGAMSALRDAGDAVKQSAALDKADAQQMLAELTLRQAAGEREEAMLYQSLFDAKISGDWQSYIQNAQQQADELTQAAKQSYLDAASSLRSARVRGTAADRIEATAVRLEEMGGLAPETDEEYSDDTMTDEPLDNAEPTDNPDENPED